MLFIQKQRMKDLLLRARVVVRTSNVKITRRHLADYVKNLIARKSVPHVQHDFFFFFFHSTNKIIDLSRCRYRSRPRFMNSLLLFHLDVQAHVSSETSALGET